MKKKNNIAVYSKSWLGVSETFIYRQITALEKNNIHNIVLTQNIKDSKLKKDYKGQVFCKEIDRLNFIYGIIVRKLRLRPNGYSATIAQKKLWKKALQDNDIQLIHAHYGPSGLSILNLAKELNIPLITTFHGNDASVMLNKKVYKDSLKLLFQYSYIITVSNFLKERLISLGAPKDKIICHYIGTDMNRFKYVEHQSIKEKVKNNDKLICLQVSNFVEKKGHIYTIKAFKKFQEKYPNAKLLLAGNGPLKDKIINLTNQLGLDKKVQFLGAVAPDRVSQLMHDSDIFLHHSVTGTNGSEEGIPTVLMEAMSSGILVISSKHAGIPELITKDTGFLVEEKNIDDYAQTLISLLDYDSREMAIKARSKVRDLFDIEKQNDKLLKIYYSIINNETIELS